MASSMYSEAATAQPGGGELMTSKGENPPLSLARSKAVDPYAVVRPRCAS